MSQRNHITLAIVEDEGLYRDLLRIALSQQPRLEVVGAFPNAAPALAEIPSLRPDVAILDINLHDSVNGVQLGLSLRRQLPDLGIVLLSNFESPDLLSSLPRNEVAGWSYLLKHSVGDAATLGRAIEGAARGLVVLDPRLVSARTPRRGDPLSRLTPRQRQILALIAQGHANAAIARQLVLAEKSVENQINLLYRELAIERDADGMHPRVQAVLRFLEHSYPPPDRDPSA